MLKNNKKKLTIKEIIEKKTDLWKFDEDGDFIETQELKDFNKKYWVESNAM